MKNYKDETIGRLCAIINGYEDSGCSLPEEHAEYRDIINKYYDEYEAELLAEREAEPCTGYSNCFILRDNEDGEVIVKAYSDDKAETMMRKVSKHICFSDCDDTFEIIGIVYHGREIEYGGWRPGMLMQYFFTKTGDLAWEESLPQYEH